MVAHTVNDLKCRSPECFPYSNKAGFKYVEANPKSQY